MARYTAHALVIGVHPWGDADKVVELFTAEKGRVRAAAFGSRRPKSTLAAALQLFNELDVSLTEGQRLDTVRTASIQHHPKKLSEDIVTMAYGSFVAECVSEFLPKNSQSLMFTICCAQFFPPSKRGIRASLLCSACISLWNLRACSSAMSAVSAAAGCFRRQRMRFSANLRAGRSARTVMPRKGRVRSRILRRFGDSSPPRWPLTGRTGKS